MSRPSLVEVTDLTSDEANDLARRKADAALSALDSVEAADAQAAEYLQDLAEFVVARKR